ncbi:MAG: protein kinase [Elusimicrobia bacterium]|nr:protein kinase [Elusimicrobiota bacterium]
MVSTRPGSGLNRLTPADRTRLHAALLAAAGPKGPGRALIERALQIREMYSDPRAFFRDLPNHFNGDQMRALHGLWYSPGVEKIKHELGIGRGFVPGNATPGINERPPNHRYGDPIRGPEVRQIAQSYKNHGPIQADAAAHALREGRVREAFDQSNRAVTLGVNTASNFVTRGLAAERLRDPQLANQDAKKALGIEPANPQAQALYQLTKGRTSATSLLDEGRAAERTASVAPGPKAGPDGMRARPHMPDDTPLNRAAAAPIPGNVQNAAALTKSAGTFLGVGDASGARRNLDKAISQDSRSVEALNMRARLNLSQGRHMDAIADATQAIGVDAHNLQALKIRAAANLKAHDHAGAIRDASEALAIDSRDVEALNTRALAYNELKDYEHGMDDALSALRLDGKSAYGYYNRAYAQAGLGNPSAALESLRAAAGLNGLFGDALRTALQLPKLEDMIHLFGDGKLDEAARAALRQKRGEPGDSFLARLGSRGLFGLVGTSLLGGGLVAFALLTLSQRKLPRVGTAATPPPFKRQRSEQEAQDADQFWQRYTVTRAMSDEGGLGRLFEALDRRLDRRVAIKKMAPEIRRDAAQLERFLVHARMAASLSHPNILGVYSIEEAGQDVYLIFEHVEGRSLEERLLRGGPIAVPEALAIFKNVGVALKHAHAKGVMHRDLNPSNIILAEDGSAKVKDFAVAREAKDASRRITNASLSRSRDPYMAPEQRRGGDCPQSDLFALGVCLHRAVTGRLPSPGVAASALVPGIPKKFDALLSRLLVLDPSKRIATPEELLREIEEVPAKA